MNFENSKVSCALAVPLLYGMDNYAYSLNKILKLFSTRKDIDENKVKSQVELGEETNCKLRSNGMPVPLLRNCYSIFNGTKYR